MKIIIFGAGMAAPHCAQYARYLGHEILCFVDNDPAKQGKTIALEPAGRGHNFVKRRTNAIDTHLYTPSRKPL